MPAYTGKKILPFKGGIIVVPVHNTNGCRRTSPFKIALMLATGQRKRKQTLWEERDTILSQPPAPSGYANKDILAGKEKQLQAAVTVGFIKPVIVRPAMVSGVARTKKKMTMYHTTEYYKYSSRICFTFQDRKHLTGLLLQILL